VRSEPIDRQSFRRLCDARELLVSRFDLEMTVAEVAGVAGLSPYHFIRKFEALFGQTPHQLRIQARLDRAKWLLARGQHSVTEACMEVGFSSLGTFSDLFARRMGESPSTYRRRVRSAVSLAGLVPPDFVPEQFFPGCLSLMASLPESAFAIFKKQSDSVVSYDDRSGSKLWPCPRIAPTGYTWPHNSKPSIPKFK
jgi:AraC-like DNA-binding protein